MILSGKEVTNKIYEEIKEDSRRLHEHGVNPAIALIRAGDNPDSISYEKQIMRSAKNCGIKTISIVLNSDASTKDMEGFLESLGKNFLVDGILILRPLNIGIDLVAISKALDKGKDIDGFRNIYLSSYTDFIPSRYNSCVTEGVFELLDFYNVSLKGKRVCVLGKSISTGVPISKKCEELGALVTSCDIYTENIEDKTKSSDIVITACGSPRFLNASYVNDKQIVIDVGVSKDNNGKISGDADFDNIKDMVYGITPVPGGTGLVTTAMLLKNTVDNAKERQNG